MNHCLVRFIISNLFVMKNVQFYAEAYERYPELREFAEEYCFRCIKKCRFPSFQMFACLMNKLSEEKPIGNVPEATPVKQDTNKKDLLCISNPADLFDTDNTEKTVIESIAPTSNTISNAASKKDGKKTFSSEVYNTVKMGKAASIIGAHSDPKKLSRSCKKKNQKGYYKNTWKNVTDKQRSFLQIDDMDGGCNR